MLRHIVSFKSLSFICIIQPYCGAKIAHSQLWLTVACAKASFLKILWYKSGFHTGVFVGGGKQSIIGNSLEI